MKNFLLTLGFAVCLSAFTSCSVDDIEQVQPPVAGVAPLTNDSNTLSKIGDEDSTATEQPAMNFETEIDPPKPPTKP